MLTQSQRDVIGRLWTQKLGQDARKLPQAERHRNLEPDSADFVNVLACGSRAKRLLEIGGSSGISTIALAAAAAHTQGRLVSIEVEPRRQAEARETLGALQLSQYVEFVLGDAGKVLDQFHDLDFVLIDCEKDDYIRFFDQLNHRSGALIVADNILSHDLSDYVAHVRRYPGAQSVTLPVGKGLELTRLP